MPCPQLPNSLETCVAKITRLILNELLGVVFWSPAASFPNSSPFPLRGTAWEVTQCLHLVMMWWDDSSTWTQLKHILWCIFTTGHTSSPGTRGRGFVSILNKPWLGNLPYVNSLNIYRIPATIQVRDLQTFLVNGQTVGMWVFAGPVASVTRTPQQPLLRSWKAATGSTWRNGRAVFQWWGQI